MKARRRISSSFRRARTASSKENIWFYTESNSANQLQDSESRLKSVRNDRFSILNNDYKRVDPEFQERRKEKKEGSFVVDWQMSDVF
jgi:hypothetical protein